MPSHPELLDWLARYFRDNGGTFKDFHRLLLHSATYRQSSTGKSPQDIEKAEAVDSGNRLYWKMNRRRLSAEEVRDSILAASGKLNPSMGGPGFYLFKLEKTAHSPTTSTTSSTRKTPTVIVVPYTALSYAHSPTLS